MKTRISILITSFLFLVFTGIFNLGCGGNDDEIITVHPYCSISQKQSDTEKEQSTEQETETTTQHYGFASIYGKFYNGLDGSVITSTSHSDLKAKVVYSTSDGIKTIDAVIPKNSDGYFYASCIPTDTIFTVEVSATNLLPYYYTHSAITDNTYGSTGNDGIYENDPNDFGRIVLYPSNVNPGDLTVKLYDSATGIFLSAASGTVLLSPSNLGGAGTDLMETTSSWTNDYYDTAPKISGSIASGTALISGTDLILGASYDVQVYDVSGYQYSASLTYTAGSENSTTLNVNLTASDSLSANALTLLSITNVTASSGNAPTYFHTEFGSSRSLVFTFNQNISIDIDALKGQDGDSIIIAAPNGDEDGDGVTNTPGAAEGVAASNITSFLTASPSVSGSTLTITFAADTILLNTGGGGILDSDDNLWFGIQKLLLRIKVKKSSDLASEYTALNTFNNLDLNSDGITDAGPMTVDDAMDVDGDSQADFLVRYPYP